MTFGICKLCGNEANLSFEHVPPRSTFNKNTRFSTIDFEKFITASNTLNLPKGKIKEGGIGYNSFCKKCNNFLGSEYVPAYQRWVQGGFELLRDKEIDFHTFKISRIEPMKILKQIVSMFLAINEKWYLNSHPNLSEFVKNSSSTILPERYQIFCYLTRAENIRYSQHLIKGNWDNLTSVQCTEISFPPYGYVLTIDSNLINDKLTNISTFKNLAEKTDLSFNLFQLPTYMPFPLDYRLKKEIEDANNN